MSEQTPKTWGKSRSVRLPGFDYSTPGTVLNFTFCVYGGEERFADQPKAEQAKDVIVESARLGQFEVLAACVMPDHVHLLFVVHRGCIPPGRWVGILKGRIRKELDPTNKWQKSFYDHIVREREAIEGHVNYILANPIRAGLVKEWRDWPGCFCGKL